MTPSTATRLLKMTAVAVAVAGLTACASIQPTPIEPDVLSQTTQADAKAMRQGVEPIGEPLTLTNAMARALKYNLERRTKLMEEAIARGQLDVTKFDMLPKLVGSAGYYWRDKSKATYTGTPPFASGSPNAVSTDADHNVAGLDFTWSLLDLSMGYYSSRQQADRVMIAGEKRRKAMQQLMLDTRTAFWRAVAAQKLKKTVSDTVAMAEEALKDSRTAEAQRVRNPVDSLRYQRQLLENMRLLESINAELSSAQLELAQLINAPQNEVIELVDAEPNDSVTHLLLDQKAEKLEGLALAQNADLRETHYNSQIAREEVRRVMAKLFPNLSLNYGFKYDSDRYLVHSNWQEAGVQLSFNLFNLFTGPTQVKLAEAGVKLADQRRMTMQMAVMTQLHLARVALDNASTQFHRADTIWGVDQKIAELVNARATAQSQSKLDLVSNATTATLSLLRRYQALAQLQSAENRLIASLGLEPKVGSTDEIALKDLEQQLAAQFKDIGDLLK
jgi:outer membrane protein TolC